MSRKLGAFDPASTASTGVVTETSDFTNLYLTFDNASTDDSSPQNVTVTDVASASYDSHNVAAGSAAILLYEGSGVSYTSSSADRLRFETSDVVLSSNFTIECFFRTTQGGGDIAGRQVLLAYSIYADSRDGYSGLLFWITSGALKLYASSGSSSWNVINNQAWGTVSVNTYHHIALTREGNVYRGYFDGARAFETTAGSFHITGSASMIGSRDTGGSYTFNGQIDDFRILNGVALHTSSSLTVPTTNVGVNVTAATFDHRTHSHVWNYPDIYKARRADTWPDLVYDTQIALYLPFNGSLTDFSSYGHTVSAVGDAAVTTSPFQLHGSCAFDGDGDLLTVPHNDIFDFVGNDFTIEGFINPTTAAGVQGVYAQWGNTGKRSFKVVISTNAKLEINGSKDGSTGGQISQIASTALELNTFSHFAVTREGSNFRIFINGINRGTTTDSDNLYNSNANIAIGGNRADNTSSTLFGNLEDFRVINGLALYTTAFEVPTRSINNTLTVNP